MDTKNYNEKSESLLNDDNTYKKQRTGSKYRQKNLTKLPGNWTRLTEYHPTTPTLYAVQLTPTPQKTKTQHTHCARYQQFPPVVLIIGNSI